MSAKDRESMDIFACPPLTFSSFERVRRWTSGVEAASAVNKDDPVISPASVGSASSSYPLTETSAAASKNCFQNYTSQLAVARAGRQIGRGNLGAIPHGTRLLCVPLDDRQRGRCYTVAANEVVVDLLQTQRNRLFQTFQSLKVCC